MPLIVFPTPEPPPVPPDVMLFVAVRFTIATVLTFESDCGFTWTDAQPAATESTTTNRLNLERRFIAPSPTVMCCDSRAPHLILSIGFGAGHE
jgi:hypothetical protein